MPRALNHTGFVLIRIFFILNTMKSYISQHNWAQLIFRVFIVSLGRGVQFICQAYKYNGRGMFILYYFTYIFTSFTMK